MRAPLLALLLGACDRSPVDGGVDTTDPVDTVDPVDTPEPSVPVPLPPVQLLIRASLDLRGVRPSLAELSQVQADPSTLDGLIDSFFADPRFGRRVRETFDEVFQIRDEDSFVPVGDLGLLWRDTAMWEAIGEEPTRMLERIATDDLPYSEFVTGDWTMANEVLGDLFLTDYPRGASGWLPVHYTDGRPRAGVLVSSGWWWQVGSMINNLNRGRANKVSSALMCFNYLNSEIDFTAAAVTNSEAALGDAIRTDPACTACHDTLDPLASTLYGFWFPSSDKSDVFSVRQYHPEQERLWRAFDAPAPAFHGQAVTGLAELGQRIAADDNYNRCFVQHSFEALLRRQPASDERDVVNAAYDRFVASGLVVREAWRSIVASEAYRNGAGDQAPKMVTPALLASVVEDLTGFHWTEEDWDLLRAPLRGYMPLAGGIDGIARTTGIVEPTPTLAAVQAQVAAMAARVVAEHDLADLSSARLLRGIDGTETVYGGPGEARLRAQLVALHLQLTGETVAEDDPQLQAELDLWGELIASGTSPLVAWTSVLTVLLRHPNLVSY
jgi:hypothetical protein